MGRGRVLLTFVLSGYIHFWAAAQSRVTDSLEHLLATAQGEQKVDILNRLTYEFITVNNNKVISYNDQALQLSRRISYIKGEGVARTYKGVFEYMSGQFPSAHSDLHAGLALSKNAGDRYNVGYTYLQLGNLGLEEVENDSALYHFTKAHEIFRDSTNPEMLSKIYRNLSAVYGQRYQYDKQRSYLDRAIVIARLLPRKAILTDALTLKANNFLRSGLLDEAETVLDEADAALGKDPVYQEDRNDILHLRALLLFQRGKFEEAVKLADSARNYYFKAALFRKYVTLLIDIGEVFSNRGEYELALNNLYAALRLSKLRGFESETYAVRNRIGWINFQLGDYNQALRLADEALQSRPKQLLKADLANALNLKGVALTEMNALPQAGVWLDSAHAIYENLNHTQGKSETLMNLGVLASRRARYADALKLYQQSIALARESNYTYGLAWSSWGLADIYFRLGDYRQSAKFLDQSEEYARMIEANEILIINFNTRRDLLAAQSRFEEALAYSKLASDLNDSIHRTDLARRFVNLEKIQEIEQRDRDIKVLRQEKQLAQDKINLQESKLQQQFVWLMLGLVSVAMFAALAFVYYRFYARIKALNILITEKNESISGQAMQLQEVNTELNLLYKEVSEQNEEIQAQSNKLSESNRSLEKMIEEKTRELRTTNEELVKYNNELLQFSYTVSHNLRGPVARLLGLSAIANSESELEKAKQWLALMTKTATDLDLVIKDLGKILDLRNKNNDHTESVDLLNEWQRSISLLEENIQGEETFVTEFDSVGKVNTVRAVIQSVFYNLLSNAMKFRAPHRALRVRVTAISVGDYVIIEIADNGLGFDTQAYAEQIFKLYKRFHSHVEGRGMGLYLIKAQVELLQGTIEVESVPGVGTVFRVRLPLSNHIQTDGASSTGIRNQR
jgi:signal transduction histidine kinase